MLPRNPPHRASVNHQSAGNLSQPKPSFDKLFDAFLFVVRHDVHPFLRFLSEAARLTSAVTFSPQGWVVFRCRLLGGFARRPGLLRSVDGQYAWSSNSY